MTGKAGRSGRKHKPTAQLRQEGGYRNYRHSDRLDAAVNPPGEPIKPADLSAESGAIWDRVIATLPVAAIGEIDTTMLAEMCRWYDRYRSAGMIHQKCKAWDRFNKLALEYGMTPAARASMRLPTATAEEVNPIVELIERLQGPN